MILPFNNIGEGNRSFIGENRSYPGKTAHTTPRIAHIQVKTAHTQKSLPGMSLAG
ncbi:hypothetical protein QY97_01248 [Bacillus thermotolerans]|nr:hypothetical protein QY97_01248 [Bacillus thermotolerans]